MLHFVLLDDDSRHNMSLSIMLNRIIEKEKLDAEIVYFAQTADELLRYAQENVRHNVYFMDLDLGKGALCTGLDVAMKIRMFDAHSYIVYITAHQEYLPDCYKSKASDFILKPFRQEQLEQCVLGIFRDYRLLSAITPLSINIGSLTYQIDQEDIIYFEKQREYVLAVLTQERFRWRESYKTLLARADSSFFLQVHKGYVVNTKRISHYNNALRCLTMCDGKVIPVSRTYRPLLQKIMDGSGGANAKR